MAKKKTAAKKKQAGKQLITRKVKKKAAKKAAVKKSAARKKVARKGAKTTKPVRLKGAKKSPVKAARKTKAASKKRPASHSLSLDDVKIIGTQLFLSTEQEVDLAERELGITFPSGYREYVTRLGDGIFGGYYVRIYPPKRILSGENNVGEWRARINEYWFWDQGEQLLPKPQALESVIIGDTLDGDELVFHPSNPERVYVLPRYQEEAYHAGHGLFAALEWLSSAGILTEAFKQREFEPADSGKPRAEAQ